MLFHKLCVCQSQNCQIKYITADELLKYYLIDTLSNTAELIATTTRVICYMSSM